MLSIYNLINYYASVTHNFHAVMIQYSFIWNSFLCNICFQAPDLKVKSLTHSNVSHSICCILLQKEEKIQYHTTLPLSARDSLS